MPAPYLTFRALRTKIAPRWLTAGDGGKLGFALDVMKDALMERVRLGHLARFPQQDATGTPGPADALDALGRDRGVIRGIDETDRSYAYRLTQWLVDARTRGTAFSLMKRLHAYVDFDGSRGVSFRVVDNRGNWFSRSSTGVETSSLNTGNWNWDGNTAKWARFWVVIYPGTRWIDSGANWGSAGNWGGSTTWGSLTITDEQTRTLRTIVADEKPAGTRCHTIIIATDANTFDPSAPEPDGTWGYWSNRLATALYLDGT